MQSIKDSEGKPPLEEPTPGSTLNVPGGYWEAQRQDPWSSAEDATRGAPIGTETQGATSPARSANVGESHDALAPFSAVRCASEPLSGNPGPCLTTSCVRHESLRAGAGCTLNSYPCEPLPWGATPTSDTAGPGCTASRGPLSTANPVGDALWGESTCDVWGDTFALEAGGEAGPGRTSDTGAWSPLSYLSSPGSICRTYVGWSSFDDARPALTLTPCGWSFCRATTFWRLESDWLRCSHYVATASVALKLPFSGVVLWEILQWLHPFDQQLGFIDASLWRSWTLFRTSMGDWCQFFVPMRHARRRPRSFVPSRSLSPCPTGDTAWFPTPSDPWELERVDAMDCFEDGPPSYHDFGGGRVSPAFLAQFPWTGHLAELVEGPCHVIHDLDPPDAYCFYDAVKAAFGWTGENTRMFLDASELPHNEGVHLLDAVAKVGQLGMANIGFVARDPQRPRESEARDLPPPGVIEYRWMLWCVGVPERDLPWLIYVPAVDYGAGPEHQQLDCAHWVAAPAGHHPIPAAPMPGLFLNPPPEHLPYWQPHHVRILDHLAVPHVGPRLRAAQYYDALGRLDHPPYFNPLALDHIRTTGTGPPSPASTVRSPEHTLTGVPALFRSLLAPTLDLAPVRGALADWMLAMEEEYRRDMHEGEQRARTLIYQAALWAAHAVPGTPDGWYYRPYTDYEEHVLLADLNQAIVNQHLLRMATRLEQVERDSRLSILLFEDDMLAAILSELPGMEQRALLAQAARERALLELSGALDRIVDVEQLARVRAADEHAREFDALCQLFIVHATPYHRRDHHAAIPRNTPNCVSRADMGDAQELSPEGNVVFIGAVPPQLLVGAHWAHDPRQQFVSRDLINLYRASGMTVCDHGAWDLWCPCIWRRVWHLGWPNEVRTTAEAVPRVVSYQILVERDGWTDTMVHNPDVFMNGPGGIQLGFRDEKYNMVAIHAGPPPQASNAHNLGDGLLFGNDPSGEGSLWTVLTLDEPAAARRFWRHLTYHILIAALLIILLGALRLCAARHASVLRGSIDALGGSAPFAAWLLSWWHWLFQAMHALVRVTIDVSDCVITRGCHSIPSPHFTDLPIPAGPTTFISTVYHIQLVMWLALGHLVSILLAVFTLAMTGWLLRFLGTILFYRRMPGVAWVPYQPRALLQRALRLFATPEQARVLLTTSIAMGDEVNAVKTILTSAKSIGHSNKFQEMTLTDHLNSAQCIVVCLRGMRFGPSPGKARAQRRKIIQNVTPHSDVRQGDCPWCGRHRPPTRFRWHMGECPDCWAVANGKRAATPQAEAWRTTGLDVGGHVGIAPIRALELPPPKIQVGGTCTMKVQRHAPLDGPREDMEICGWGLGFLLWCARPYVTEKSYVGLIKGVLCRLAKARKHDPDPEAWRRASEFNDLLFPYDWDSNKVEPYTQEEWRKGFHPRRIKAFNQAWDVYVWLGEMWCARYERFTIFLKREWLADGADGMPIQIGKPRIIQSPHDITHVLIGPALKRLTHLLKAWWHISHPIFYASVTPTKLDAWLNSLPEDAVYLWCDYKMFDATHSRESWEFVRAWYETLLPESFIADHHWKAVMDAWQNPRGNAYAKTGEKVRYAAEGINASGRDDTALANALLNGVAMMIALTAVDNGVHPREVTRAQVSASLAQFRLAVVGDDSVAALPAMRRNGEPWLNAGPDVAAAISYFGFEAEVGTSAHRADAVFLGQRPYRYHTGWHWGPTLGRRLYKHHCLLAPAVHRSAWLHGVADMEVRAYNHVPVLRQMAHAVCRILKGRKRTKWSMHRDGHSNHDPEYVVDWSNRCLQVEPDDLTYEELVGVYQRAGFAITRADFHHLERQAEDAVRLPTVVTGELATALAQTDL